MGLELSVSRCSANLWFDHVPLLIPRAVQSTNPAPGEEGEEADATLLWSPSCSYYFVASICVPGTGIAALLNPSRGAGGQLGEPCLWGAGPGQGQAVHSGDPSPPWGRLQLLPHGKRCLCGAGGESEGSTAKDKSVGCCGLTLSRTLVWWEQLSCVQSRISSF